ARIRAATSRRSAYEEQPPPGGPPREVAWRVLVPSAVDAGGPPIWKWTTERPPAGWTGSAFGDSAWRTGAGGFGAKGGWEGSTGPPGPAAVPGPRGTFGGAGVESAAAFLVLHYDNATRVSVNGREVLSLEGWNDSYEPFEVTQDLRAALAKGEYRIAVHVHQD